MEGVEVLVLHGSPGAGKTTLSRAISVLLRHADVAHAVIDLDDLDLVYPHRGRSFSRENLRLVWPNYTRVGHVKVVIPSVITSEQEREELRAAVPCSKFMVCELTAPESVLQTRVTARETGSYWQERLRGFVDLYHRRTDLALVRDFQVDTDGQSVELAAADVVEKAGWLRRPQVTDG